MKIQRGWKKGTDPAGCKRRSCKTSMCGDISRHWFIPKAIQQNQRAGKDHQERERGTNFRSIKYIRIKITKVNYFFLCTVMEYSSLIHI